jgi:hypothetical protein
MRSRLPNCIPFRAGQFGLTKTCVATAEAIGFIPKSDLQAERGPMGIVDDVVFRDIVRAIGYVIESDCEPSV